MPISIMVDAGHGGSDPGAVYNGRMEKDDNLQLALAVGRILQNQGVDVQYTRTTDVFVPLAERAGMANRAGVDYFVSIHRNSYPTDNEVSGVETLVYDLSGIKHDMAQNIDAGLENIGFINLGEKERPNLAVLKRTAMPAILVEAGFLNSERDNTLFDQNFDQIASTIANGMLLAVQEQDEDEGVYGADMNGVGSYSVQVGLYRNRMMAERLLNDLRAQGFPADMDQSGQYDRIKVGDFADLDQATEMERRLKRAGYQTLVVTRRA